MKNTNKIEAQERQSKEGIKALTSQSHTIKILNPKFEILIGGAYKIGSEEHNFGHVAIRVITNELDTTYDFGRYGRTWGTGDSEGDGMLNVWKDFSRYIAGENATGRKTTGFVFNTDLQKAEAINYYFSELVSKGKLQAKRDLMERYKLSTDYHALKFNCTTISVSGAKAGVPNFDNGSSSFIEGRSLSFTEKMAAKAVGWPSRIFLPADLQAFLMSKKDVVKVNEYPTKK